MAQNRPTTINGEPVPYGATIEELRQRLKQPGTFAWAAFEALGHTPGTEALQLLIEAACSTDWRYRRSAVEAINDHILTSQSADALLGALEDQNLYVVITACRAVAHHRISQAHTQLLSLLAHPEPSVREAAVMALANIWQAQDFKLVKQLHNLDGFSEVSKAAADTLFANVNETTWRDLFNLWQSSPIGRNRLRAVHLAHEFGGEESGELLSGYQNDKDGHVRKAVILTRAV